MASRKENTAMFEAKGAQDLYAAVVAKSRARIGARALAEDPKQTCVHLVATKSGVAFAGLHPRKGALMLNMRVSEPLASKRVRKIEKASANRYHCEMVLSHKDEVDDELLSWLQDAWALASESSSRPRAK